MTKIERFLKLANPNKHGKSRWVNIRDFGNETSEFVNEYADLTFGNGADWARKDSTLGKKYIIEFDTSKNPGNSNDRMRLNGFQIIDIGSQNIRSDIKKKIKKKRCFLLGTSKPEVDHKNGRKDDLRVMKTTTQSVDDFQPLSKSANDAKRQFCKECKETGKRYDARKLGYSIAFVEGTEIYDKSIGCKGCYWFDIFEFRKKLFLKK